MELGRGTDRHVKVELGIQNNFPQDAGSEKKQPASHRIVVELTFDGFRCALTGRSRE